MWVHPPLMYIPISSEITCLPSQLLHIVWVWWANIRPSSNNYEFSPRILKAKHYVHQPSQWETTLQHTIWFGILGHFVDVCCKKNKKHVDVWDCRKLCGSKHSEVMKIYKH
jgi:hypothetical protein